MSGAVPTSHGWCTHCRLAEGRCVDHERGDYDGPDAYEPTEWVLGVVGQRFRLAGVGPDYECVGYDPRSGFWMRLESGDETCVSERAINRTFIELSRCRRLEEGT